MTAMLAAWMLAAMLGATIDGPAGGHADGGAGSALLPSGTRARQTPAVRESPPPAGPTAGPQKTDNGGAPGAQMAPGAQENKDRTAGARDLDRGGTPRTEEHQAAPDQMSDVPLTPPVAPPAEAPPGQGQPKKTGGGAERVNDIHR